MADSKKDNSDPSKSLREDSIVSKLKATGTPPGGLASYTGLLGRSSKDGHWVLYLNLDMSRYVEVREDDIVHAEQLPPERSPFGSLGGTTVFVKKGAQVTTTTSVSQTHAAEGDEFDLDIRIGGGQQMVAAPNTNGPGCTFGTGCTGGECPTGANRTCLTCVSCGGTCRATCFDTCIRTDCNQQTCDTCRTQCDATCVTCNQTCATCQTRCNQPTCQATCATCATRCNQATCVTCQTKCNQATCKTCVTCAGDDTCRACTHVTCFNTCAPC